jgi:subtilisin family serine protease
MKRIFSLTIVLALLLAFVPSAAATSGDNPLNLFVPDMTGEFFAEALVADTAEEVSLPLQIGYWTDLVNTENVSETGDGVYVAILDTGILPGFGPFFFSEANIAWHLGKGFSHDVYWDDVLGDVVFSDLDDTRGFWTDLASGHGTHVASTVVGFNVNNSYWVEGVAPKATIIPVLVLDAWEVDSPYGLLRFRGGTDEMISAGIYYVADLELDGPVVINMSLGGPSPSPMIEAAIDYAISKGVIIVASAGNEGTTGMGYPGGLEQVISAGAAGWTEWAVYGWQADAPEKYNKKDVFGNNWKIYLEEFSSRPNKDLDQKHQDLDVSAPGAAIVGPYKSAFANNVGYYYLYGTSMAAPHVSGIAALVLETHPTVDQAMMESILTKAAAGNPLPASDAYMQDYWGEYWLYWDGGDFGKGFLMADQAMKASGK